MSPQPRPKIQSPTSASDMASTTVEDSPLAKVNVLTATMEALGQGSPEKAERSTETRRLKISWPPQSELEDITSRSGTTPTVDGGCASKPIRPKWPPEEDSPSLDPEGSTETPCLRRSSSLKERILPFTRPKQTSNTPPAPEARNQSPPPAVDNEQYSPESSSMELHHSGQSSDSQTPTEDSCVDVHTSSGGKEQEGEMKNEYHQLIKEEDDVPDEQDKMEEEDGGVLEEEMPPLKHQETPTDMSSPEGEARASLSSQDVGFWDSEVVDDKEADEQQEVLSVEEMIKRNRCYEDEEDV